MNTQLLERLSKATGSNFLEIERDKDAGEVIGIYVYRKGTMRKVMKIGGIDEDRLFCAICERIEAEGWFYMVKNMSHPISRGLKYYEVHVSTDSAHRNFYVGESRGENSIHPWEAAALALCEALEGKQEEVAG